jgi:hypothetical protein
MAIQYTNLFHCKAPKKLPKIENFGSKKCHLAAQLAALPWPAVDDILTFMSDSWTNPIFIFLAAEIGIQGGGGREPQILASEAAMTSFLFPLAEEAVAQTFDTSNCFFLRAEQARDTNPGPSGFTWGQCYDRCLGQFLTLL